MSRKWENLGDEIRQTVQNAADKRKKVKQAPVKVLTDVPSRSGALLTTVMGFWVGISSLIKIAGRTIAIYMLEGIFDLELALFGTTGNLISLVLMAAGFILGGLGAASLSRLKRFKKYAAAIGYKEYCNLSDLAKAAGVKTKKVIKDMNYMIEKGWFKQGHLDNQNTCLMITDKMYEEYCLLEQQKAAADQMQKEQAKRAQMEKEEQAAFRRNLPLEVQKVIAQGEEYIRKIRACNDAIPGIEVSEKIDQIEMLVDKIFDRVEQEPKCIDDIRKLMDYYLPTTVKLLEAYADMDAQPVGGDNINTAKKEIETTLDTINTAFEKLLDSLFLEKAWDVSTDISVLNTMLAQEGLKEDGLKK